MSARKFGNSWWVDFSIHDERHRKRSPDNSLRGARAYELHLRQRLARGEDINAKTVANADLEFQTFAARWFDDYAVPNNKPSEQRSKRNILRSSLVPFFEHMPVDRIAIGDIERYKLSEKQKGVGNKTINNKLAVLRKCLACAWEWHGLKGEPPKIKPLKFVIARPDFLTSEESAALLAHAKGAVLEMILLALRGGLRQGEIRGLQWDSIDWESRTLVVRHSRCDYGKILTSPKSNRERTIPLSQDVLPLLWARRETSGYVFRNTYGDPFTRYILLRRLDRVSKAAGLRKIGWHTLRHTFASALSVNNVPMRVVQELLGHSTILMTMRYAHVTSGHLHEAIRTLGTAARGSEKFGNRPAIETIPA